MRTLALGLALMSNEPPPPEVADPEPRRGHVAVGLGIAGIVAGAPMVLTGGMFWLNPGRPATPSEGAQPPPLGPILLGTGIASATLGAVGVIVGAHLNGKWKAWAARKPGRVSRLELAPTGWAGRESFGFAIAGRF